MKNYNDFDDYSGLFVSAEVGFIGGAGYSKDPSFLWTDTKATDSTSAKYISLTGIGITYGVDYYIPNEKLPWAED